MHLDVAKYAFQQLLGWPGGGGGGGGGGKGVGSISCRYFLCHTFSIECSFLLYARYIAAMSRVLYVILHNMCSSYYNFDPICAMFSSAVKKRVSSFCRPRALSNGSLRFIYIRATAACYVCVDGFGNYGDSVTWNRHFHCVRG